MTTPLNFLGLEPPLSDYARSRYAVLPVPCEQTVSYRGGTAGGPAAIIEASQQVELVDEELRIEFAKPGVATLPAVRPHDDPAETFRRVHAAALQAVCDGKWLLTLGGEHSLTTPCVRAVVESGGPVAVLQIDAHADLRASYDGTDHSHAAVMRRVLEIDGVEALAQVGIRSFSPEELADCPDLIDAAITPRVLRNAPDWIDRTLGLLPANLPVYVTIDIDGLDPSIAPGTGTPEPDGLTWPQATDLLRILCTQRQVLAADIVEVRPLGDNHVTEFLAARLACKLIAWTQRPAKR
jgi:agmatinase